MTKCKNVYLLIAMIGLNSYAQELVPNNSFEEYTALPSDGEDWDDCVSWTNAGGDHDAEIYHFGPDYFHTEAEEDLGLQLPDLAFADLSAHSGNAIMGFVGYRDPEFYESETVRSYLSIALEEPMEIGHTYAVSFWISNGEAEHGFRYKCDGIGILFSTSELDQSGANYIDREPQYQIEDELFTTEWEQYTFEFIADSAYTQLTIGNFFSDEETAVSAAVEGPLPFDMAYYFVDDFSVEDVTGSGIKSNAQNAAILIYPNPTRNFINIELTSEEECKYFISSADGKLLLENTFIGSSVISLNELSKGVYFITIEQKSGATTKKLIIE